MGDILPLYVRFCLLTTCCTGMGCGAIGAGPHCVVDMVLFCQFWPPVSFFSPGWLQCISGLKMDEQMTENNKHRQALSIFFFFFAFFRSISQKTCCKKENCSNVFSFLLVDSSPFTIFYFVFMIPVRRIMNFKDQLYCKCGRNMNVNLALTLYGGTLSQTPSGKSN